MKNSKNLERSNEFYKMMGTRDMYNGTSMKMNKWEPKTFYAHDDNIIDFVSYNECLLFCVRSHWSDESNAPVVMYDSEENIIGIEPNPFWEFVHGRGLRGRAGIDGKDGVNGKDGAIGPQGPQGPKGDPGSIEGQLNVEVDVQASDSAFVNSNL